MNTKIFCDIADLNLIKKFNKKKIVKGFTTNPSLMRKAGAKNYELYSKQILNVCKKKPISFEVFADDYKSMIEQGSKISKWGKNVYVKVPVINSKKQFTGKVIKELNSQNIKLNITAVYKASHTKKILKMINKKTKVIISIFAGRAADAGREGASNSRRGRSKVGDSRLAEREAVTSTLSVGMRTGAKASASKSERTAIGRGSSSL